MNSSSNESQPFQLIPINENMNEDQIILFSTLNSTIQEIQKMSFNMMQVKTFVKENAIRQNYQYKTLKQSLRESRNEIKESKNEIIKETIKGQRTISKEKKWGKIIAKYSPYLLYFFVLLFINQFSSTHFKVLGDEIKTYGQQLQEYMGEKISELPSKFKEFVTFPSFFSKDFWRKSMYIVLGVVVVCYYSTSIVSFLTSTLVTILIKLFLLLLVSSTIYIQYHFSSTELWVSVIYLANFFIFYMRGHRYGCVVDTLMI